LLDCFSQASAASIRQHVKDTEKAKKDLETSLSAVEEEIAWLTTDAKRVTALIALEAVADNELCAAIKKRKLMFRFRSSRDSARDAVTASMRNFHAELKGSLFKQFAKDIQKYHKALSKVDQQLRLEIQLKEQSTSLDVECLALQPPGTLGEDGGEAAISRVIHHSYPAPTSPREREESHSPIRTTGRKSSNFNHLDDSAFNTRKWKEKITDTMHHAALKVGHVSSLRSTLHPSNGPRVV
jgi:hypothetical protein